MTFRKPALILSSGKEITYIDGPLRHNHSHNTGSTSVSAFLPENGSTASFRNVVLS
jgi:hypothetical protein